MGKEQAGRPVLCTSGASAFLDAHFQEKIWVLRNSGFADGPEGTRSTRYCSFALLPTRTVKLFLQTVSKSHLKGSCVTELISEFNRS